MRLRKKTWSSEVFDIFASYWYDIENAPKGNWKKILKTDTLRVEIGSGKGGYWHQLSALNPEDGVVALEKDYTATSIALKKLTQYPSDKKKLIYGNAENLSDLFAEKEVDYIYLNFSDPWPKLRHEKRRLTYKTKLDDYLNILSDNGYLIMKTDNVELFNYSVVSIGHSNFELIELDVDFRAKEQEDPFTEYERKFTELGQPIFRGVWKKYETK